MTRVFDHRESRKGEASEAAVEAWDPNCSPIRVRVRVRVKMRMRMMVSGFQLLPEPEP